MTKENKIKEMAAGALYGLLQRPLVQPMSVAYTIGVNQKLGLVPSIVATYKGGINSLPTNSFRNFYKGALSEAAKETIGRAPGKFGSLLFFKPWLDQNVAGYPLATQCLCGGIIFGGTTSFATEFLAQPLDYSRRRLGYGQPLVYSEIYKPFLPNFFRMANTWGIWYGSGKILSHYGVNLTSFSGAVCGGLVQSFILTLPSLHLDATAATMTANPDLYTDGSFKTFKSAISNVGTRNGLHGLGAKIIYNWMLAACANLTFAVVPEMIKFFDEMTDKPNEHPENHSTKDSPLKQSTELDHVDISRHTKTKESENVDNSPTIMSEEKRSL